ncbi:secreted glucosidase [Fusarium flagelliforme]|uniref:secreted glucosidase n=1 Tax=Fusarium flagelliforme TaxID=2675880 RepID=UPI001E8D40EA|nr:secreted glucosidase [Fusarium flagelliforme]KAH7184667.1 secreted glucosidase [Fusarium flagelliforme]
MRLFLIFILLFLAALAATEQAPGYEGFNLIWEDTFSGPAGSLPDQSKWIMQDWYKNLNGDFQTYTTSRANQQHTGHGSLVIIPLRDPSAQRGWTSDRLKGAYTFTPAPGAKTIAEAEIKLGSASKSGKQGIWPAFWLLGDSHRKGTLIWPTCGEIDILENVNGEPKTQGVIHCDKNPNGICNEKNGIAGALDLPDSGRGFHTYTAMIDRTPGDWRQESVSFFVDGRQYHRVTGARIGNEEVWGKVAHNLVHFILNVAVGGEWVSQECPV